MSGWTEFNANGALADVEVANFQPASYTRDSVLCVLLKYNSAAATQLQIFSATGAGVAAEFRNMIYDSAFQTNPGPDSTQYLNDFPSQIIIAASTPWTLRITKAASNARLWWRTTLLAGPGC